MPPSTRLVPALLTALGAVLAALVALSVLQRDYLPSSNRHGIDSATALAGQSPFTVHVAFAVGLLATLTLTFLAPRIERLFSGSASLARMLFVVLLIVWALNSARCNQGFPFGIDGDAFHEGEYVGYRQTYLAEGFNSCMLIHGPLLNILPGVVAGPYSEDGYSIAVSRGCRSLFGLISVIGFLWVLWELARYYSATPTGPTFRLLVLAAISLEGLLYLNTSRTIMGPFRDAAFYVAVALLLCWLHPAQGSSLRDLGIGVALGALSIVGLLVSYERGATWPAVFALGAVLGVASRGWTSSLRLVTSALIGAAASAAAIGKDTLTEIMTQASYWAKYGDVMFADIPDVDTLLDSPYFVAQLVVIFGTLSWVIRDCLCRQTSLREWISELAPLLTVLLVAALTERRVLARGDLPHYQMAGMPCVLVVAALLLLLDRRSAADGRPGWLAKVSAQLERTAVMAIVVLSLMLTHPNCVPAGPMAYLTEWAPNRLKVHDKTRDIIAAVSESGPLGPKDLYPLDSAGVWFYLTSSASPTRFHQVVYAMPASSQQEVVDDLERNQTRLILVPPESYRFDGVALAAMFPIIQEYLDSHYTQASVVHGYRILKRKQ